MALLEVKKEFTPRELNWFGPLFALFVCILSIVFWYRFQWQVATVGLGIVSALLIFVYYLFPSIQRHIYRGWIYSVYPIGWTISHLLLAAVFYFLMTPIGLIMRAVRYDPMRRKMDRTAATYWTRRSATPPPKRYFKQY